jgi:hypothetical protein
LKVRVLKPLNHKGKTVKENKVVELEDVTAKKLIELKAVEEIKEVTTQVVKATVGDAK